MKKLPIQYLLVLFSGLICMILFGSVPVEGAELPSGLVIGDTQGFYATSEGEYFIDMEKVMPGDLFTKTISIRNVDKKEAFDVSFLVADGESSGSIDFKEAVTVTLEFQGKEIYKGGLLGTDTFDWTKVPIELGVYESGGEGVLKATFEVSKDLTLEDYQEPSEYKFYWVFLAHSTDSTNPSTSTENSSTSDSSKTIISADNHSSLKPTGKFPSTGEELESFIYKIIAGLLIAALLLLFLKKRREDKTGNQQYKGGGQ